MKFARWWMAMTPSIRNPAAAAGLELKRLLWVRCRKLDQVLKSTDLLLQGGGFGRVVMDLTDLPLLARPIRFIGIVVPFPTDDRKNSHRPHRHDVAKRCSIGRGTGAANGYAQCRMLVDDFLNGLNLNIEIVRSRRPHSLKSDVRVHLHSECIR